ncbi:unnamed protein product [Acanthoscelides obtectus]|uniref:Uncharacterized protein n=1 Tax=Acanthoscelides obtectus TaxID=200917 RepID=A0A9P0PZ49_ACAOB|nr:unnamed protein product [Acanthoscelides obtectus]CAK1649750.1 hypothetical protein AOBTE_LOCUS16399 [Acanthoscelides obtectus]
MDVIVKWEDGTIDCVNLNEIAPIDINVIFMQKRMSYVFPSKQIQTFRICE